MNKENIELMNELMNHKYRRSTRTEIQKPKQRK